ncbi:MAG: nitrate reductase molybdenum cofactor assembly chaperone [Alphaproteobacteria bacterium]
MQTSLKALSAILSYPSAEIQAARDEILAAIDADAALPAIERGCIAKLVFDVCDADLLDAQAAYVDLFDRTRSLSLHLFEHVHGESRDRGQAMVALRERYVSAGFDIAANELPDHLPLLLEFLSMRSREEARELLADIGPIVAGIAERLKRRESAYGAAFEALTSLSQTQPEAPMNEPAEEPDDFAALDRIWEEAEVRFGPGDAKDGCPRASELLAKIGAETQVPQRQPAKGVGP